MNDLVTNFGLIALVASFGVALSAGVVKGAVGFAMPMIMISGIGSFMPAEVAIAALILPTLVTNFVQAFANGLRHCWASVKSFWRFIFALIVVIFITAQTVTLLPQSVLFLAIGGPLVIFGTLQLAGWQIRFSRVKRNSIEWMMGSVSGFFGGLTGVWGPPLIMYLLAMNTPKIEQIRVQGVIYSIGSVILLSAHLNSGVMNEQTIPYSAAMIVPAVLGQFVGARINARLNQKLFRKATLIVLVIAGFNLLRRGFLV